MAATNLDSLTLDSGLTVTAGGLTVTAGGLTVSAGGLTISAGNFTVPDDTLLRLGSSKAALTNRASALSANTALTGITAGTPVSAATPADSLLIGNLVANGDIAFFLNLGGTNAAEALRFDSSAGLIVVNEAGADWDFRVEGDNNANMLTIDAGTDSLSVGAAVVSGAFLTIDGSAVNRAGVTAVGRGEHMPAATFTQTNADPTTLAIGARVAIGIPTFAGANANQTLTDAAALYVAGAAAAGSNMTLTRAYSLWVDAGVARFDGGIKIADRGTVTQATNKATGVTLNNRSGAITMNNAALAAAAEVGFTLTNSTIGANDVVIVNVASGATADSYGVTVDAVAAGSCRISLTNLSAGSLSEAIVLNFVVIGGDV